MTQNLQTPLRRFLRTETGGAAVLLAATLDALAWANVDPAGYAATWHAVLVIRSGRRELADSWQGWVNSGLMSFFFLVAGLEARREFDMGELRERRRLALPVVVALGGMVVPVAIYLAVNAGRPSASGWARAMATDTAFALGVLALAGPSVPDRVHRGADRVPFRQVKVVAHADLLSVADDRGAGRRGAVRTRLLSAGMLAAYGLLMTPAVQSMVAATYVRDIGTSRAFYELLGFREQSAGSAATSAWSSLHHGELSVLLTSTTPPLDIPQLPLLFYFFYADVDAVIRILGAAGVQVTHTGHPPHALGGEVKVLDPDGNTVLLGQREPSASQPAAADDGATVRFSLLREAAALVSARGGTGHQCQVRGRQGRPCPNKADVKLADSMGDRAWVCLVHADEILVTVPEAFIASEGGQGLAAFLSRP